MPRASIVPAVLNTADVAEILRTSTRTFHRLRSAGMIPKPFIIGSRPRWKRDEILAWIDAGCPDRATWEVIRDASREQEGGRA